MSQTSWIQQISPDSHVALLNLLSAPNPKNPQLHRRACPHHLGLGPRVRSNSCCLFNSNSQPSSTRRRSSRRRASSFWYGDISIRSLPIVLSESVCRKLNPEFKKKMVKCLAVSPSQLVSAKLCSMHNLTLLPMGCTELLYKKPLLLSIRRMI